jgi:hypothetical protein
MADCESCKGAFAPERVNDKLARNLESFFPNCACEQFSVGTGSPGRIYDDEVLYRAFVDPTDVDPQTSDVSHSAFRWAHSNGLSVFRECASDDDVKTIVSELLAAKPGKPAKTVLALFRVRCRQIRSLTENRIEGAPRMFCVYDQTVLRMVDMGLPPVPTHAGIFFRHLLPSGVVRKHLQKDCETVLYKVISADRVDVAAFRGGLIVSLNEQSRAGAFVLQQH